MLEHLRFRLFNKLLAWLEEVGRESFIIELQRSGIPRARAEKIASEFDKKFKKSGRAR